MSCINFVVTQRLLPVLRQKPIDIFIPFYNICLFSTSQKKIFWEVFLAQNKQQKEKKMKRHVIAAVVMMLIGLVLPAEATNTPLTIRLGVERAMVKATMQQGDTLPYEQAQTADEALQGLAEAYPPYKKYIEHVRQEHDALVRILRRTDSYKYLRCQNAMSKMEDLATYFRKWQQEEEQTASLNPQVREQCLHALDHLYEYEGKLVGLNAAAKDIYQCMEAYVLAPTGLPNWGDFYKSFSDTTLRVK